MTTKVIYPLDTVLRGLILQKAPKTDVEGFTQITTDTRQIQEGALFVPIKGERFDGHDFIQKAVEAGAAGVVMEKQYKDKIGDLGSTLILEVEDSLLAYRSIAFEWLQSHTVPIAMVAGSVGKTTTKEMLASLVRGRFNYVLKTQGSQNGFLGIPMTILELNRHHQFAVIEVGIDDIGAMKKHLDFLQPTGAVVTAIAEEHLFQLKNITTVAQEESLALMDTALEGGLAVVNLDDPWLAPLAEELITKDVICISLRDSAGSYKGSLEGAAYRNLLEAKYSADGKNLILNGLKFEDFEVPLPLPGHHNARNLLCAIALARGLGGLTEPEIIEGMSHFAEEFKSAYGRSDLQMLGQGVKVLCDYYNANPASMESAFSVLNGLGGNDQILALGEMRELGDREENFHRALAPSIIKNDVKHVLLMGSLMKHLQDELQKLKFPGQVTYYEDHSKMGDALKSSLSSGDVALIKGSRGLQMEKVWERLKELDTQ